MNNFELNDYSVTCSLNQRTIFIKIINRISFICYESNLDITEFRLSFGIEDIYKIMLKCFKNQNEDANVFLELNSSDTMKVIFNVKLLVGLEDNNYFNINFDILLNEKLMSNDLQLSVDFHRIEQKQAQDMKMLMDRIMKLEELVEANSYAELCLYDGYNYNQSYGGHLPKYFPMNVTTLSLTENLGWNWNKIQYFNKLETLTIQNNYNNGQIHFNSNSLTNINFKSNTLKFLTIHSCHQFSSFNGLHELPNLVKLTITSCAAVNNLVTVLSSYKHKIKEIDITSCGAINNTELMTYCQTKNIKLNLK